MVAALIALIPFLPSAIVNIVKAIAELKASGASDADIAALMQALSTDIKGLDADLMAVLAHIPEPTK